jgi:transporter family-2 protein
MTLLLVLFALFGGSLLAIQPGVNAQLGAHAGNPVWAAMVSFVVGALSLLSFLTATRSPWPSGAALAQAPWWAWIGGVLGAVYVSAAVIGAPRLGAAVLVGLVIAGQTITALVIDHWGLVGLPVHHINAGRLAGAALLLAGVALIRMF